jgi:hypothetical protein
MCEVQGGHGDDETEPGEVTSLRRVFAERRLSIRTMDRPLRLATGLALADMLVVAVLIALRDVPAPSVFVGRNHDVDVVMSMPLFIAALVLLAFGFAYIATAAVLASWPVAVSALALVTGAIGVETGAFGGLFGAANLLQLFPTWARWTSRGLLVAVWVVAGGVLVARRRGIGTSRSFRLEILGVYVAVFGGYLAVVRVALPTIGGLNNFGQAIDLLMTDVVLLVYPLLLAASVDFGEWGSLAGERIVAAVPRSRARVRIALAALACLSLAVFGYVNLLDGPGLLSGERLLRLGRTVLLSGLAVGVLVGVGRLLKVHRRRWPVNPGFAAIFVVVALGSYLVAPLSGVFARYLTSSGPVETVSANSTFTGNADVVRAAGGKATTAYTLLVPRGWVHATSGTVNMWTTYLVPDAPKHNAVGSVFQRVGVQTLPLTASAAQFLVKGDHPVGAEQHDGPWTRQQFTAPGADLLVWARPDPAAQGATYELVEVVKGAPFVDSRELFDAIGHSFRTAGQPPATLPAAEEQSGSAREFDHTVAYDVLISAGLSVIALVLAWLFGRRWPPRPWLSVLFLGTVTLASALYFADSIGRAWFGPSTRWPYLGQHGVLTGVGVLGLVALAVGARARPRYRARLAGALLALCGAVWVLQLMQALYAKAISAGRVSVWAAVTVLVAVAWDVTMSGDALTNHGTRHVPRATRVLAFFGYVLLLTATVLFYSAQRAAISGRATEAFFEPEAVTRNALFRVALPLVVLLFLLRVGTPTRENEAVDDTPDPRPQTVTPGAAAQ